MDNALKIAKQELLHPTNLNENNLQSLIGNLLGRQIDTADLYFQSCVDECWVLEDSIVKEASYSMERGVGVRAVAGEKTGFAYSEELELKSLIDATRAAKYIAQGSGDAKSIKTSSMIPTPLYPSNNPLASISTAEKISLLEKIDKLARAIDPRVSKVNASLSASYEIILITNSAGLLTADIRPLVRVDVRVIVEQNGKREQGVAGGGGRSDYSLLFTNDLALGFAKEAVRQALLNLEAIPAPAGVMPVVLGPGWPGVLLHEAIGHGLEGDFNRKGVSAFSGRIGDRVAAPEVTVVDNGSLAGRRGSLTVDDEGTPTQSTTLIENGILKGYLLDNLNAKLLGMKSTGNSRRESYAYVPIPRMTNTYMLAGKYDPEEIIRSVNKGIYAKNFSGGQVDITSGKFVFSASEAYLIENGKLGQPIKGATLIGSGPEVLKHVSMIGNNLELDAGVGVCGKEGQSVPVGVGQPTLKLDELTVGGTA